MARPQRSRRICALPEYTRFSPVGGERQAAVVLSLDEYEAFRLMDYTGCTHEQCAAIMQISRTTATEIYASARRKIADALVNGKAVVFDGGSVRLCDHAASGQCLECGLPQKFAEAQNRVSETS